MSNPRNGLMHDNIQGKFSGSQKSSSQINMLNNNLIKIQSHYFF